MVRPSTSMIPLPDSTGSLSGYCSPSWNAGPQSRPREIITNGLEMDFVWIQPGTFWMGSPRNEKNRNDDEFQHRVALTRGFFMGVHPVTRGQFATFIRHTGFKTRAEREGGTYIFSGQGLKKDPAALWRNPESENMDNHPVTYVSWHDAVAFAGWLSGQENKNFRLPTESEWEYVCRAGTATPFSFGETINSDQANFDGFWTYLKEKGNFRQKTTIVGSYLANAWKLHDMHGNIWEWCQDWYGNYPRIDVSDPQGANSGQYRVMRGGSWYYHSDFCRSACRNYNDPDFRYFDCGFRLCFTLD